MLVEPQVPCRLANETGHCVSCCCTGVETRRCEVLKDVRDARRDTAHYPRDVRGGGYTVVGWGAGTGRPCCGGMPMSSDEFLAIQYDALRAAKLGPGSVATNTPRHLQNIWNCSWVGGRRELRGAGSLLYPKEERTRQGMLGNELSGSQHLSREIQIPQRNPLRATQHNREAAWMTPPLMWPAHTLHGKVVIRERRV